MRILLQLDPAITTALPLMLRADGWIVDHAEPDDDLDMWTGSSEFDLVVTCSYATAKALRIAGDKTPVMLLASLEVHARVAALTAGIDDVVNPGCDVQEIRARAAAIARRARGIGIPVIVAGPMIVDLNRHNVTVNGRGVHLTGKEQMILEALITRDGRTQSKGDLMSALYDPGVDEPEQKIVDVFVCKLRKKLTEAGAGSPIETVWGRGYRFRGYPEQARAAA